MKTIKKQNLNIILISMLRIMVGWHFLYEGISKLASTNWSSFSYLMESKWIFSGFFHWLISNSEILKVVDFVNIWGLITIGVGLMIGLCTRFASISGVLLLMLYYIANPPFLHSNAPAEGHYFIINKNLIEAGILLFIAALKNNYLWGLDRLLKEIKEQRKEQKFPKADNHEILENTNKRRELIKNLAVIPIFGGAFWGMAKKQGWFSHEENGLEKIDAKTSASSLLAKGKDVRELKGKVPMGKIKQVELSLIIPGGNLISGFAHSRDLIYVSPLIKNYFNDEKIIETLWLYEACGINATVMRTDEETVRILKEFWRRGGKIQWLAQTYPKGDDLSNVKMAIDNGAIGAFVMGSIADKIVYEDRLEDLITPIEFIRSQGLIGGTAAHSIKVPMACVDNAIEVDFFMKTFHHDKYWSAHPTENRSVFTELQPSSPDHNHYHDNLWCRSVQETEDFFKNCKIPWIAYKVLAAGAISPKDGISFAYKSGADFTCVGMFDFQVVENANIVHDLLKSGLKREREWYAL